MRRHTAVLVFITAATTVTTSCDDGFGLDRRDYEGFYSYAGTVDDEFGDNVVGTIVITRQRRDRADVSVDWSYLDRGVEIIRITTDRSAEADLGSNGRIEFEFRGDLEDGLDLIGFRLTHQGRLRGNTIEGDWQLRTEYPSTDRGSFIARR
jgi:hypothetical protein